MASVGPAATPSLRMSQPAFASRATFSAMKFAIAPPDVSAPPASGQAEHVLREPAAIPARSRSPPAEAPSPRVPVESGRQEIRGGPGHRPGAGDVGVEPRMPEVAGVVERDPAEVVEELVLGHGLVGHGDHDGVAHLLHSPGARDGEIPEPGQELLVDVRDAVGERAGALRIPVEIADGFRSLDHHASFVAASTNPSFAMKRRKPSSPKTS